MARPLDKLCCVALFAFVIHGHSADVLKQHMDSYFGSTPTIDGKIEPSEWKDATAFTGVQGWAPQFDNVTEDADLSLKGWVKHDQEWLYFAFDITDDVLYGIDTPRWLPSNNSDAHEFSPNGFPWFGDMMEVLINAPNTWDGEDTSEGTSASWQMVCNVTKSRLGGIGRGGLMEGEPRTNPEAWATYQKWILIGAQKAVVRLKPDGSGYVIEWAVRFDECMEMKPGKFYSPNVGRHTVGLNIALGDLDEREKGEGKWGNFHHEQWWSGKKNSRIQKNNFGTLTLHGTKPLPHE